MVFVTGEAIVYAFVYENMAPRTSFIQYHV